MLVQGITEPQAPALDANLTKIILNGGSEEESPYEGTDDIMAPEVVASGCQQTVWPRVWPGL
jgi:hypothetical protein